MATALRFGPTSSPATTAALLGACIVAFAAVGIASAADPIPRDTGALTSVGGDRGATCSGSCGTVWVQRMPTNRVRVKVRIDDGLPGKTYTVNRNGLGDIGEVITDAYGRGTADILT